MSYNYAVTLTKVPDYGRVKILFGADEQVHKKLNDGTMVISDKEINRQRHLRSLKEYLKKNGYM